MKNNFIVWTILSFTFFSLYALISFLQLTYGVQQFSQGSGSMEPTIMRDDKIDANDKESFDAIKIGDIIAFRAPDSVEENKVIVHRVTAIITDGNNLTGDVILCAPIAIDEVIQEKTILAKGDANECSIPGIDFPITSENYIGKVERIYDSFGLTRNFENPKDTQWNSYSSPTNGLSFQYPDNWKTTYDSKSKPEIILSNRPNTDSITISNLNESSLLTHKNSSLLEIAKKDFENVYGVIVLDPFVEKTINGHDGVIGKIAEEKLVNDTINQQVKDIILLQNNNSIHMIEYSDTSDNYNENKRDEIWKRFTLSLNFSK